MSIPKLIEGILDREGGYVNNPNDRGGETNWGITVAVARENGYAGPMRDLSRQKAIDIYTRQYVTGPKFDEIAKLSPQIGEEVVDTGVNMGTHIAAVFFQRALNVLNNRGGRYPDVAVDGKIGPATLSAFRSFLVWRGREGEDVLYKALNCMQGARYIELAEARAQNEEFVFGWLKNRVS